MSYTDDGVVLALAALGLVSAGALVRQRVGSTATEAELLDLVAFSHPQGPTEAQYAAYEQLESMGWSPYDIDQATQRIRNADPQRRARVVGHGSSAFDLESALSRQQGGVPARKPKEKWIAEAITRTGKLGGKGYTRRPWAQRQQILDECVAEYGYRSCLGSIQVLINIGGTSKHPYSADVIETLEHDKAYLMTTYGGPGTFGPRGSKCGCMEPAGSMAKRASSVKPNWSFVRKTMKKDIIIRNILQRFGDKDPDRRAEQRRRMERLPIRKVEEIWSEAVAIAEGAK